jgi:transcriptional regulator with XRE-family HTH domain
VILQQLCAARGLTLDQLAEAAGVPRTTVAQLEAGTLHAQPVTLRRLGAVLGLDPVALQDAFSAARRQRAERTRTPPGDSR